MALVHRSKKVTHCLSATKQYMSRFFSTLTHMYEMGLQTDLNLVASDGTTFSIHKIMLIGCSSFVREMLPKDLTCDCENLSIYLPDFKPRTIKNLLSLMYTGVTVGDCSAKDLKALIDTLQINIKNLVRSDEPPPPDDFFDGDEEPTDASPLLDGTQDDDGVDDDDEMLEVTPEVQMFFGNHFMAGGEDERGGRHDEDGGGVRIGNGEKINGGNDLNGETTLSSVGQKGYLCRLCGHMAPNGASLFAHLLYPHYAHLWRTEIPHRANKYDCTQCPYQTTKRQHFVMHVARVHDDLKKKMEALGENLEILDNLSPKTQTTNTELIPSVIAKPRIVDDTFGEDSMTQSPYARDDHADSPPSSKFSPSTKDRLAQKGDFLGGDFSPAKAAAFSAALSSSQAMMAAASAAAALGGDPFGLMQNRFPRGFKPWVKCRLCGKGWKGKDNFFTHLVSTHFKYLWATEVPKHADMFQCHVGTCNYQSKYRYNFLFHLAGKHKQLKQKLAAAGIPLDVLTPEESDGAEFESGMSPASGSNGGAASGGSAALLEALRRSKLLLQQQQQKRLSDGSPGGMVSPSMMKLGGGGRGKAAQSPAGASASNTRLVCRVCHKVSLNHTCHRQHVVGKHFQEFWAHHTADHMGIFHCHHTTCSYKTPNRSVFVIHLAYVHSELKTKLIESGRDPNCATPDVYGKRKYRRDQFETPPPHGGLSGRGGLQADAAGTSSGAGGSGLMSSRGDDEAGSSGRTVKYRCKLCQAESGKYLVLIEHLAVYHFGHIWDDPSDSNPFSVPESGPYSCQLCTYNSSSRQNFICHSVSKHDILKQVMAHHYDDKTVDDLIDVLSDENGDLSDLKMDDEEGDEDDEEEEEFAEAASDASAW